MCRFVLYRGPALTLASLITEPAHSLINQSIASKESEEPLNGDGFGVAWFVPELSGEPAVFRSVTPAWNNMNLLRLARVTKSPCILAHVRAATQGLPVTELNCHPFAKGPYALMHNGDIGGFDHLRRKLLGTLSDEAFNSIQGSTDSEHFFGVFLDQIRRAGGAGAQKLGEALEASVRAIVELSKREGIAEPTYLNVAVSDGLAAAACRFTTDEPDKAASLHLHTGRRYVCEGGVCRMIAPEAGTGAVLISSEPLSDDAGWQTIKPNQLVLVNEDSTVEQRPMKIAA